MEEKTYWIYVIELENGQKYVGQTNNLTRRLEEHKNGRSRYTKRSNSIQLVYTEEFETRSQAMAQEKFLKSGKGRLWLKQKIAEQSALGG